MLDNLFAALAPLDPHGPEQVDDLLRRPGLRIQRIVSTGQASPPGFWYDQPEGEWVLVLSGSAGLRLADEAKTRTLRPGQYLDIPPRCRHRVEWTEAGAVTVWLAVFYGAD